MRGICLPISPYVQGVECRGTGVVVAYGRYGGGVARVGRKPGCLSETVVAGGHARRCLETNRKIQDQPWLAERADPGAILEYVPQKGGVRMTNKARPWPNPENLVVHYGYLRFAISIADLSSAVLAQRYGNVNRILIR